MTEGADGHQQFEELCALAYSGTLTSRESRALDRHLRACEECRDLYQQFKLLAQEGLPLLAESYSSFAEASAWEGAAARRKLFARIRGAEPPIPAPLISAGGSVNLSKRWCMANPWIRGAVAACVVAAVAAGGYHLGSRVHPPTLQPVSWQQDRLAGIAAEKQSLDAQLDSRTREIAQLIDESRKQQQEVDRLRLAVRAMQDHSSEANSARINAEQQLQEVSQRSDDLSRQLEEAQRSYQALRSELATSRTDREQDALRAVTLQAKIDELNASNRDQERRLKDSEQFLASDRDIRELMGARKLYIADVFDVDSVSRARKPFGRVFYTQNKSLIFYAFDLDHEPGIKNASTFQVWGQRETAAGEQAHPLNLGILYMDSEANRRWVLRSDDPKQLNEIDAVFVTVEPRGGSQKPTGKPFLYALLRKEANHP